ncbi:cytochrome c oxidase subunit II [Halococcoides cellulosivorans]|uniref:cytochrome-c oxidase n=1 Tax=Halococcoides cellulosivorans TaxID=1679096 RepID=A0A2R4X1C1_9EURY|nr:cytochrome c oxidase subunit II [Halococcoides cellulosivorans]AWB27597.1 cytochrome c oxidase subunit II [Halococcoides cellulosivorans]
MRFVRPLVAVLTGGFVLASAGVVAADPLTNSAETISGLSNILLAIAIPITLLVEGLLAYAIWKFRKSESATPTEENRRLEIAWTAATAVVLLVVGILAYSALGAPSVTATEESVQETIETGDPVVVDVIGYQWGWTFSYPEHGFNTTDQLTVPANRTVVMRIHSSDVVHSVHVPALGLKMDAIPGRTNYIETTIRPAAVRDEPYVLYCAEFCGAGHSDMLADLTVTTQSDYDDWVANQTASRSET